MNLLDVRLKKSNAILLFIVFLILSMILFHVNTILVSDDVVLLLPYIIVLSFSTLLIGPRVGLIFSILTIVLWFTAKTNMFLNLSWTSLMNLVLKTFFVFLIYALTKHMRHLYSEVKELSLIDGLTGLNNRRGFIFLAQYEVNQLRRDAKFMSLLYIDVDNFKVMNDARGHKEGDKILHNLSEAIITNTRNNDISARIGGDEFCVLLPDADQLEIKVIAVRIADKFKQLCEKHSWYLSLSIGAFTTDKVMKLEEIINNGDALMYKAKKSGKNRIEYSV